MRRIRKTLAACALCSKTRELQDSHVIPRGCYNRLRGHQKSTVNIVNGNAFLSQKQLRAKLLCRDCEGKFNSKGEKLSYRRKKYRQTAPLLFLLVKDRCIG
jgi:5-methylcytosine-specific restriction endonuclease McrA